MLSLSTSASHHCKYIMSFSHFNSEMHVRSTEHERVCVCVSISDSHFIYFQQHNTANLPFFWYKFGIHCVCACVCTMHTFAFFSAAANSVAISKITLLNYWTIVIKGLVKCEKVRQRTHTQPYCSNFSMSFGTLCWLVVFLHFIHCWKSLASTQAWACRKVLLALIAYHAIPCHICICTLASMCSIFSFRRIVFCHFPFQTKFNSCKQQ